MTNLNRIQNNYYRAVFSFTVDDEKIRMLMDVGKYVERGLCLDYNIGS